MKKNGLLVKVGHVLRVADVWHELGPDLLVQQPFPFPLDVLEREIV